MPARYELNAASDLATLYLWGTVSADTIVEAGEALSADPGWDDSFRRLWDWREITAMVVDVKDVKGLAQRVRENWTHAPRVAIVATRPADLEIARLLKAYLQDIKLEVFKDMASALAFLEAPE